MSDIEFLQEKWRTWFASLDVHKDGRLTEKKWSDAADFLINAHSLNDDDAELARKKMTKLGEAVLGQGQTTVTQDQFVQNLATFFEKSKDSALSYIKSIVRALFDVMDTNNDLMVDEQAFVVMCRAFGHSEETARDVFKTISDGETQISVDLCVDFWTEVWFGEDKEKWHNIAEVIHQ